jgi:hypothetical protein
MHAEMIRCTAVHPVNDQFIHRDHQCLLRNKRSMDHDSDRNIRTRTLLTLRPSRSSLAGSPMQFVPLQLLFSVSKMISAATSLREQVLTTRRVLHSNLRFRHILSTRLLTLTSNFRPPVHLRPVFLSMFIGPAF